MLHQPLLIADPQCRLLTSTEHQVPPDSALIGTQAATIQPITCFSNRFEPTGRQLLCDGMRFASLFRGLDRLTDINQ